jgi:hypothetical protein
MPPATVMGPGCCHGEGTTLGGRFVTDGDNPAVPAYDIRPMRKASETIGGPSANNTKAIPVRVPEKINTQVTRTKRHYPAHGGTTATMAMQAR